MNSAKKRIALAITLAEPGGVTSFVLGFAKWLKIQGHEVRIFAGEGDWLFQKGQEASLDVRRIPHLKRAIHPFNDLLAYQELKTALREFAPDAIHLNSTKIGIMGSRAARSLDVPRIVYRIGGWTFLEPLSPFLTWLYRSAEQWTAAWKDTIVCVHPGDEAVAKREKIIPKNDLRTVPNGIDLPTFDANLIPRERARQQLGLAADTFVFGTIAHLYPAKNLPQYMEACSLVQQKLPNAKFLLLGEGMERTAIESARRAYGLEQSVLMPGALENASSYLLAFDAFVLPSAKEGMSWALLEAMAAERPCIATDVGANNWLIGNIAGWIVPPQNPHLLAKAMTEAATQTEEAQTRRALARQIIAQRFQLNDTYQGNEQALLD